MRSVSTTAAKTTRKHSIPRAGSAARSVYSGNEANSGASAGGTRLMTKTEQRLRVVVQDLVGIGLWQSQPLDIGEGLLVGLVIL
jgi:hypothetical protein